MSNSSFEDKGPRRNNSCVWADIPSLARGHERVVAKVSVEVFSLAFISLNDVQVIRLALLAALDHPLLQVKS